MPRLARILVLQLFPLTPKHVNFELVAIDTNTLVKQSLMVNLNKITNNVVIGTSSINYIAILAQHCN